MTFRRSLLLAIFLSSIACLALLHWTLQRPIGSFTQGDAEGYHAGAVSLLTVGQYQFRGLPYTEREPGQSIFLAGVYAVFGIGNIGAVFFVQWLMAAAAIACFALEARRQHGERAALIAAWLLLLSAPVFHTIFTLNREGLALSLCMTMVCMLARTLRTRSILDALGASTLFAALLLTYIPYMVLPVMLLPALWWLGMRWRALAAFMLVPCIALGLWGTWVQRHTGAFCISSCYRSSVVWYVRGEQARDVHGLEPLRCLWAEYVTRDWTDRSPSCPFNAIMHRKWPDGLNLDQRDLDAATEGRAVIRQHFANYLWFSIFEVIELHLPYVNGWGRWYNVAAVAWTLLLYLGIPLGIAAWRRPTPLLWLSWTVIAYSTGLFALTDAIPRYLLPILFAYALLAGIGYDRLLSRQRP